jgi:hypothetical protein
MPPSTHSQEEIAMIVFGVSSTVAIVLMVVGVLAYVADGASAVRKRSQRKDRVASVYGSSPKTPSERG